MTEAVSPPDAGSTTDPGGVAPPARADGIVLIGEMKGSGYRVPPALVRRADGQTAQLTPLLYATLEAMDGQRSYDEIAAVVAQASGKPVSPDNARELVSKLRPIGLAVREDGAQPEVKRSNPLLGLRFKVAVTDEEKTRRITAPFAALFALGVVIPIMLVFAWITWWVLFDKGLASATHEAFARPGLLLTVLAITVLSAGFHEFGHAAAARRGGATPGVMGAGLYLVWPAFYTDVTDSYRLGRAGRLRTDLGGLYFNAIVAVATAGVWWLTRYDAILLLIATQILQMLRQLLPFVRFDGYHVLADLTGVPDLFHRIGPTLRSLIPWRPTEPQAKDLKPWARAVVTIWVLTVIPVLLGVMVMMILALPRIVGTAWASAGAQQDQMAVAFGEGDLISVMARALSMVIVVLPIAAFTYILVRLSRQVGGGIWRKTEGKPLRRGLAGLTVLALIAGLVLAWWPSETRYRPIQAYEGGTVTDFFPVSSTGDFRVGSQGAGTVMWPDGTDLPTRAKPQLATVLVPTGSTGPAAATALDAEQGDTVPEPGDVEVAGSDTWIFPFDEPLAPDEGDNQALAANTTDDTASYSVAFALVWADGAEPLQNTNEAYAAASCENCAAVAVAFQVVLVVGEANAVAPQNISVAVNYDCTSCLTYSLAVQLFVTLDGPLSHEATASIETLWNEINTYGANIGQVPLDEIQGQLTQYEQQILGIIEEDQGPLTDEEPTESPTPSDGSSPTESPTSTPSESPSQSPTGSPTPTGSPSTSPTPTPTTSPTPSPTTSPTPTPTTSPSPTATPTPTPTASAKPSSSTSPAPTPATASP
ncbi:hypothetical protein [Nocardioides sp.]|uniref:hypothetical protein n=1 Tax=Nocardioides sp. TaxID=35761 RepID=UPI002B27AE64|nr:hypothetical protein [Nocardioides sp.]